MSTTRRRSTEEDGDQEPGDETPSSNPAIREYEELERSNDPTRKARDLDKPYVVRAQERMDEVYAERGRKS